MWLLLENPITYKRDDNYMRNKRGDAFTSVILSTKFMSCSSASGGKPPEADEGSALEPRWGTSLPQAFLALPQPLTPGDATESNRTIVVTCIGASFLRKFLQCVSPPLASRRSARLSSADALSRIKYRN